MFDEQFLTSPFLPARFHLVSHQLKFFEGALRAPLGPTGPGHLSRLPRPLGGPGCSGHRLQISANYNRRGGPYQYSRYVIILQQAALQQLYSAAVAATIAATIITVYYSPNQSHARCLCSSAYGALQICL